MSIAPHPNSGPLPPGSAICEYQGSASVKAAHIYAHVISIELSFPSSHGSEQLNYNMVWEST